MDIALWFWFSVDKSAVFSSCNKLNDVFSIDALSFGYIVVPLWMYWSKWADMLKLCNIYSAEAVLWSIQYRFLFFILIQLLLVNKHEFFSLHHWCSLLDCTKLQLWGLWTSLFHMTKAVKEHTGIVCSAFNQISSGPSRSFESVFGILGWQWIVYDRWEPKVPF